MPPPNCVYKRRDLKWKPVYAWLLSGRRARDAITTLLPYLKIKRADAEKALARYQPMSHEECGRRTGRYRRYGVPQKECLF